jgi:Tfp pilus assembly protein PilO
MKISTREIVLGISTLSIILFGLTYWMGGTVIEEQRSMKEEKARLVRQIALHQRILEQQGSWQQPLNDLQTQLPVYGRRTSVTVELPKLIKHIADKTRLTLPLTQPQGEKKIGTLYELKVRCDWQGSLESLVRFLYDIHEQGIRFDVRQINLKPVAKQVDQLKGSMVINCAYRREE